MRNYFFCVIYVLGGEGRGGGGEAPVLRKGEKRKGVFRPETKGVQN